MSTVRIRSPALRLTVRKDRFSLVLVLFQSHQHARFQPLLTHCYAGCRVPTAGSGAGGDLRDYIDAIDAPAQVLGIYDNKASRTPTPLPRGRGLTCRPHQKRQPPCDVQRG